MNKISQVCWIATNHFIALYYISYNSILRDYLNNKKHEWTITKIRNLASNSRGLNCSSALFEAAATYTEQEQKDIPLIVHMHVRIREHLSNITVSDSSVIASTMEDYFWSKNEIALKMQISAANEQHGHFYVTPRFPHHVIWFVGDMHLATYDIAFLHDLINSKLLVLNCSRQHQTNCHCTSAADDPSEASSTMTACCCFFLFQSRRK